MGSIIDKARANIATVGAIAGGIAVIGLVIALLLTRTTLANTKVKLTEERAAHAQTVANYREAAAQAQADATANAKRVLTEQQAITEEVSSDYQAQLASVRARADALRVQLAASAAHPGSSATGGASEVPAAAGGSDAAAAQAGLPAQDWSLEDRVIATEQAIQLQALQEWVRKQAGIDYQGATPAPASPPATR